MYRPSKNRAIYSVLVSLLRGWELNLVIIKKVKVSMGEEEIIVIIIKEFIVGIYILELNLFRLIARVFCRRVCRQKLKLIAACLTVL